MSKSYLLILDRDGTLNEMVTNVDHGLIDSPLHPSQVKLIDGVVEALKQLRDLGCSFSIATNQPAAAKGKTTLDNLKAVHQSVLDALSDGGIEILSSHVCFHRAEDACACRKPKTELLKDALKANLSFSQADSWMVGDGITDIQAGAALGLKTAFLGTKKNEMLQAFEVIHLEPDFWGAKLIDFASWFSKNIVSK